MKKKTRKAIPRTKGKKTVRAKPRPKKAKKAAPKSKARKKAKAAAKPKMSVIPPPNSTLVGRVEDYFAKIGVIAFTVKKPIHAGDHLHVLGHTTNLEQTLDSMQIDHQPVSEAKPVSASVINESLAVTLTTDALAVSMSNAATGV